MTYEIDIRNIAGIRAGGAEMHPGVNVVTAENWQGKSSFVTALQVVMGTTGLDGEHPLTDGAAEGTVTLRAPSGTYETELVRDGDRVRRQGDVYLTDEQDRTCAHLFAFLGEENPIRAAVRSDGDLADLLTRPLDMENIDEQIAQLQNERRAVETELERATDAADQLPSVQSAVERLEQEIEELEDERDELRDDEGGSEAHDELTDKRTRREQLSNQVRTVENKIDRLEDRLEERERELDGIEVPDEPSPGADIESKQSRIDDLETNITLLEDLYRVNKRIVDEDRADVVTDVERTLAGDEIECWVCGTTTSAEAVEDRLAAIDDQLTELRSERATLREEIEEIQARRDEIEQERLRKRDLESEIGELERNLAEERSRRDDLEERLAAVEDEVADLEATIDSATDRVTDFESEIKYKRAELEDKRAELEQLEADAGRRDQLEDEYDELTAEIERLRARRNEKKRELAARFEETMADIIDTFEPGFEAARLTPKTDADGRIDDFDLVVARDGKETSLRALSEGELELLGIVTALAGYETFGVSERVPMILLDGLTALSSANLHSLVAYLRDRTELLVATAPPEVEDFGEYVVSPREWDVISHRPSPPT